MRPVPQPGDNCGKSHLGPVRSSRMLIGDCKDGWFFPPNKLDQVIGAYLPAR